MSRLLVCILVVSLFSSSAFSDEDCPPKLSVLGYAKNEPFVALVNLSIYPFSVMIRSGVYGYSKIGKVSENVLKRLESYRRNWRVAELPYAAIYALSVALNRHIPRRIEGTDYDYETQAYDGNPEEDSMLFMVGFSSEDGEGDEFRFANAQDRIAQMNPQKQPVIEAKGIKDFLSKMVEEAKNTAKNGPFMFGDYSGHGIHDERGPVGFSVGSEALLLPYLEQLAERRRLYRLGQGLLANADLSEQKRASIREEMEKLVRINYDNGTEVFEPEDVRFVFENAVFGKGSIVKFGACGTGSGKEGEKLALAFGAVFQPLGGKQVHCRITSTSESSFSYADTKVGDWLYAPAKMVRNVGSLLFSGDPALEYTNRRNPVAVFEIPPSEGEPVSEAR